nr:uncharacterized protein LOC101885506 isoform X2 [Danio rerio]|eukprot:XP_021328669.1 uncharacterized protein LOC101885506 isoform X2 [Danio rerio]
MMGSVQLSYLRLLNLFIAALLECGAQRPCEQPHQLNISRVQRDSMSISCLTTTHLLETLTVKLRKNNPVKDILISPASEHQKWSVSKHAGNIRLNLKDIQQTDEGLYDCEVYKDQDCLNATRFTLTVKDCTKMKSVTAVSGSAVLLPCSEHPQRNTTDKVTWKVIEGHGSTDITKYRSSSTTSNSTEKLSNPLFERARQLENGSLFIRDSVKADDLWYRCRVNEKTCYEVKLVIKVAMRRPCEKLHELNISCVQHSNMYVSCLTTTHPLESLMVKLRKNNPVKDILIYPDISPASEHQRWSVRKHAGNVTLGLKDVRLSDEGLYECQVYKDQDCLNATRFILTVKGENNISETIK